MNRIIFIGKIRANNKLLEKKQIRSFARCFFLIKFFKIFKSTFRALF